MYMNAAFDNVCFKGSVVSQSARFVYLCLCKHADNTHQTCFPSLKRIAEIVGRSISTIKRAVRELCKYGAIERAPRYRKDGGQTSNLYKIAECSFEEITEAEEKTSADELIIGQEVETNREEINTEETYTEITDTEVTISEELIAEQKAVSAEEQQNNDISFSESSNIEAPPAPTCAPACTQEQSRSTETDATNEKAEEPGVDNLNSIIYTLLNSNSRETTVCDNPTLIHVSEKLQQSYKKAIKSKVLFKLISRIKGLNFKLHICQPKKSDENELGGGQGRPPKNFFN